MNLIYMWIEESYNKVIKHQGFNFSNEYHVEFDNNIIAITQNEYLKGFWGNNISDVYAIVGKNGSGKSTILKEFVYQHQHLPVSINDKNFYVFEDNSDLYIFGSDKAADYLSKIKPVNCKILSEKTFGEKIRFLYVSNSFDGQFPFMADGKIDVKCNDMELGKDNNIYNGKIDNEQFCIRTSDQLLAKDWVKSFMVNYANDSSGIDYSQFYGYKSFETASILKYLSSSKKVTTFTRTININFNIPGNIENVITYIKRWSFNAIPDDFSDFERKMKKIEVVYKSNTEILKYYIFLITIFAAGFLTFSSTVSQGYKSKDKYENNSCRDLLSLCAVYNHLLSMYYSNAIHDSRFIDRIKDFFDSNINYSYEFFQIKKQWALNIIDDLKNFYKLVDEIETKSHLRNSGLYFEAVVTTDKFNIDLLSDCLLPLYQHSCDPNAFIYAIHNSDLSSGEYYRLVLLSRIYTWYREEKRRNIDYIILIDEIDIYFHPEMQRIILSEVIELLNGLDQNFKLIITTHSPIVLSDIPSSNIIYVKNENGTCIRDHNKHSETFGSNIYKLFDDAFFMGENGQMGQYAKSKIQYIINEIIPHENKDTKKYESPSLSAEQFSQLSKEIDIIGEPILKDKLIDMLDHCKYQNAGSKTFEQIKLEKQKLEIERKLKELKNEEGEL